MSRKPFIQGEDAFTLVEVVVATLLLVTVVAFVYTMFATSARFIRPYYGEGHYLAKNRLEELLEEVRQDRWNVVTQPLNPAFNPPAQTFTINNVPYTRDYTVDDLTTTPGRPYRRVRMTVTWPDNP